MVKISESKIGQYRVTINPQVMTIFGLDSNKEYEWINVDGLPALRVKN